MRTMHTLNPLILVCGLGLMAADVAADRITDYTYNAQGLIESIDGPRTDVNDLTLYEYDTQGNRIRITNALGQITEITEHDASGRPLTVIDPNGRTTHLIYDLRGRLTSQSVSDCVDTQTTSYTYDLAGNLTQVTQPDNSSLTYAYDDAHRLIGIEDSLGNRIDYTLDAMGNRLSEQIRDAGAILRYTQQKVYDQLGQLSELLDYQSNATDYSYDGNGNLTGQTDAENNATEHAFDALNRLQQTTDALNGTTHYSYDGQGNLISVTDPRGLVTSYTYDGLSNLLTQTSPDTGVTTYTYDEAGNRLSRTDARGVVTQYAYDALNRMLSETYPANPTLNVTYSYDDTSNGNKGIGHLTGFQDSSGSTAYTYDAFGNLLTDQRVIGGVTYTTGYTYDTANHITSIIPPMGQTLTYTRDALGRITKVEISGPAGSGTVAQNILYMPFGGIKALEYGNGLTLNRTYDQSYRLSADQGARNMTYAYTPSGNISAIGDQNEAEKSQGFIYDPLHRLIEEVGEYGLKSYEYDAVGNREESVWNLTDGTTETVSLTYAGDSNRQTKWKNQAINYTAAGNMTNTRASNAFVYDERHRIVSASNNGVVTASFEYNALGQRVRKQTPDQVYVFHYGQDGKLLGVTLDNGALTAREIIYVWVDDMVVGRWEYRLNPSGQLLWRNVTYLHTDHLNTPRIGTDDTQTVVWRWDSDAFGVGIQDVDPDGDGNSINMRLRFAGQYNDVETGLYYNYFRDYNPTTGRYIESDPIGLDGGLNTYAYVGGNPLSFIDPLGLDCTAANGTVTCNVPGGPQISFPQPAGWPSSLKPGDSYYHYYNKSANLPSGVDKKCVEDYLKNHPTPGSPNPATPEGTPNDASPNWAAPFKSSPVKSYTMTSNGSPVVVNVTLPGHPLFPGYVARDVNGGVVNNFGEGTGWLQGPNSPFADPINNVWYGLTDDAIKACSCQQ